VGGGFRSGTGKAAACGGKPRKGGVATRALKKYAASEGRIKGKKTQLNKERRFFYLLGTKPKGNAGDAGLKLQEKRTVQGGKKPRGTPATKQFFCINRRRAYMSKNAREKKDSSKNELWGLGGLLARDQPQRGGA